MSKQSSKPTMALVSWGYNYIRIPLDKAHKIQELLSGEDVTLCSNDWATKSGRNMYTLSTFNIPSVEVCDRGKMTVVLTMLQDVQRHEYQKEVLSPYREGESDVIMGVEEWLALRGDK